MRTKISWAHHVWRPWNGCNKVSEGCKHCWAERLARQQGRRFDLVVRGTEVAFNEPLQLRHKVIFVDSESDFFHAAADDWREEAWGIMRRATDNIYLILTKRINEAISKSLFPPDWGAGWDHVWLGVSIENQRNTNRARLLIDQVAARHKFVSAEPLLSPLDLGPYLGSPGSDKVEWLLTGGESGTVSESHLIRPCDPLWIVNLHEQCNTAGAVHYHKQNGGVFKHEGEYGGFHIGANEYRDLPDFFPQDQQTEQLSLF